MAICVLLLLLLLLSKDLKNKTKQKAAEHCVMVKQTRKKTEKNETLVSSCMPHCNSLDKSISVCRVIDFKLRVFPWINGCSFLSTLQSIAIQHCCENDSNIQRTFRCGVITTTVLWYTKTSQHPELRMFSAS